VMLTTRLPGPFVGGLFFWSRYGKPSVSGQFKPGVSGNAKLPSTNTLPASRDRETPLAAIAKARIWIEEMCAGRTSSFAEIAKREGKCERHIRLLAPLAFVAPFLVTDLLKGSAPANGVTKAARKLSFSWSLQQL